MGINKSKIKELMNTYFDGNYNAFARELRLNVAHLHRTLNNPNSKAGAKFLGAILVFCENHKLNYKDYIFLEEPLTTCNSNEKVKLPKTKIQKEVVNQ